MSVANPDSVEKVVTRYFAAITKVPFTYGKIEITPKPLVVSSTLARGYTCPPDCGACCPKFTLDYIDNEEKPDGVEERSVTFNGNNITVWSDQQKLNTGTHCQHVSSVDARCAIHSVRPFSCDFELVRAYIGLTNPKNRIGLGKFGRSWNLTRAVGGGKGTLCEVLTPSPEAIADTIRKLERLQAWSNYFGLTETWIPEIIDFLRSEKYVAGNLVLVPEGYVEPEKTNFKRTKIAAPEATKTQVVVNVDDSDMEVALIDLMAKEAAAKKQLSEVQLSKNVLLREIATGFPEDATYFIKSDSDSGCSVVVEFTK